MSDVVRIDSSISFHMSKLSNVLISLHKEINDLALSWYWLLTERHSEFRVHQEIIR